MHTKFTLATCVACLGLAACGGDGTNNANKISAQEAETIDATYADYNDRIDSGDLMASSPEGKATMSGYIGIDVGEEEGDLTALGDLDLDVNFNAGTATGTASNFGLYALDEGTKEGDVSGTLDIAGNVAGSAMTANATGRLSDGETPVDLDLDLVGTFYDDAGTTLVAGDVSGTMSDPDEVSNIDGGFYATED